MNTKIKLISSYDKKYQNLFNSYLKFSFLRNNLQEFFELSEHIFDLKDSCTNKYIVARLEQLNQIIYFIENSKKNLDSYAISLDSDMIIFPEFSNSILDITRKSDYDLYFMSENKEQTIPSFGLIIFKINNSCLKFFKELSNSIINNSQSLPSYISNLLIKNDIRYKILDLKFANNNYSDSLYNEFFMTDKLCCFHATNSSNILDKVNVLNQMILNHKKYSKIFRPKIYFADWERVLQTYN